MKSSTLIFGLFLSLIFLYSSNNMVEAAKKSKGIEDTDFSSSETLPNERAEAMAKEKYSNEDFKAALEYSSKRFSQCCLDNFMDASCVELVCKYGLDADFMRSAFITKCSIDQLPPFMFCSSGKTDNYNCCRSLGVSHECCEEYMSFKIFYKEYNPDKFLSQCLDIFKAISYCPVFHY